MYHASASLGWEGWYRASPFSKDYAFSLWWTHRVDLSICSPGASFRHPTVSCTVAVLGIRSVRSHSQPLSCLLSAVFALRQSSVVLALHAIFSCIY
ncbi:hypothetical protein J6590_079926 [Homalodisca vitripennis]|nr:hypothetical protein J6590_079926 [Homalodisca vitripennis]